VPVSDKEYEHTILRGIPTDLATFASQILSSVLVIQSATPINIDALINLINEEAERLKSRRTRGHSGQGGKKDATTDEALAATSSEGGKKKHRKGNCHNCGKAGHWARECRSPKKEKDDSAGTTAVQTSSTSHKLDNKPVGSANAITVHNEEGDGFWMVENEAVVPAPNVSAEPDPLLGAPDEIEDAPHREKRRIQSSVRRSGLGQSSHPVMRLIIASASNCTTRAQHNISALTKQTSHPTHPYLHQSS
jgi:hypothetical protein